MIVQEYLIFFKRLALFSVAIAACVVVVNWAYIRFVFSKEQIYRQRVQYEQFVAELPSRAISYAFFGDSHTRNAIDPRMIPGAFNFGTSAENYIETYYQLRRILDVDRVTIETAVFELDPHTFSTLLTDEGRAFDDLYFYWRSLPLRELMRIRNLSPLGLVRAYITEVLFPSFGRGQDLIEAVFAPPKLTEIHRGWTRDAEDFSTMDMEVLASRAASKHFGGQERISPLAFEYFLKTLALAKDRGIRIMFLQHPLSQQYVAEIDTKYGGSKDYYKTIFAAIDQAFSVRGYERLNYESLFFDHPEYFSNPDHLNEKGAEIFTTEILRSATRNSE